MPTARESLISSLEKDPDIHPTSRAVILSKIDDVADLIDSGKISYKDLKNLDLTRENYYIHNLRNLFERAPKFKKDALVDLLDCGFTFLGLYNCRYTWTVHGLLKYSEQIRYLIGTFDPAMRPQIVDKLLNLPPDLLIRTIRENTTDYLNSIEDDININPSSAHRRLLKMNENEFLSTISKNEMMAKFVLATPELKDKLNNSMSGQACQTFENSCTAYAIMQLLYRFELLPTLSRSKELEIYTRIWSKPGDVANIALTIKYLKSQLIPADIIEDTLTTDAVLNSSPNLRRQYTEEIKSQQVTEYKNKQLDDVIEKNLNCHLLLIVHNGSRFHTLILSRDGNAYTITDPANMKTEEGRTFADLVNKIPKLNPSYSNIGIALRVLEPKKPEKKFFFHEKSAVSFKNEREYAARIANDAILNDKELRKKKENK